jgi:hypothetical protein
LSAFSLRATGIDSAEAVAATFFGTSGIGIWFHAIKSHEGR